MPFSMCSSLTLIQITSGNTAPHSTGNPSTRSKKVNSYISQHSHLVGLEENKIFSRYLGQNIQNLNSYRVIRHLGKFELFLSSSLIFCLQ